MTKRAHIICWLARYGDDPKHAIHARVALEWLRRHPDQLSGKP